MFYFETQKMKSPKNEKSRKMKKRKNRKNEKWKIPKFQNLPTIYFIGKNLWLRKNEKSKNRKNEKLKNRKNEKSEKNP